MKPVDLGLSELFRKFIFSQFFIIFCRFVNTLARADSREPNLFVYMTYQNNLPGVAGIAWLGVVCDSDKGYKTSINEYFYNDLDSAEIVAHEIGHNLNMDHDFNGSPGVAKSCSGGETCTNIGTVMDYYQVSFCFVSAT